MHSPLISVIIPVYNSEKYLRHCVDSILRQTYKNLEIILVDDGATDSSGKIVDEFATSDSRVKPIHQENGGISVAQNNGLDNATGEYIAFCDNDDIMHEQALEILLQALEVSGADMSKARWQQFGVSQILEISQISQQKLADKEHLTVFDNPLNKYQNVFSKVLRIVGGKKGEAYYFNEANWCRLYRSGVWEGVRFPVGQYAQDVRVAGPLYEHMNTVADVDCVLYYWLQDSASVTHSSQPPMYWHDNVDALQRSITPCRSYYGMTGALIDFSHCIRDMKESYSSEQKIAQAQELFETDKARVEALLNKLSISQRVKSETLTQIRRVEKMVYDRKIHRMK